MQDKLRFTNVTLVTPTSLQNKDLLTSGNRIVDIIERNEPIGEDWKAIDGYDCYIFPGMIDLLQHGFLDYLYNDAASHCIINSSRDLPKVGVTGYLPSISSLPPDTTANVLTALAKECDLSKNGSRVLGRTKNINIFNLNDFSTNFRIFGNFILTKISNFINNQSLTDVHTCYKIFRKEVFFALKLREKGFSFCPEVTTKLSKLSYGIVEVPIKYNGREVAEGKKIGFKDAFSAIFTTLKYRYFI